LIQLIRKYTTENGNLKKNDVIGKTD